jgi:hypothetical protein
LEGVRGDFPKWELGVRFLRQRFCREVGIAPVAESQVAVLLENKRRDPKYLRPFKSEEAGNEWIKWADAASVLRDVINKLTEARVRFDKVKHSVQLTEWLAENKPEQLAEVKDLIVLSLSSKGEN